MNSLAKSVCAVMILIVTLSILTATGAPGATAAQDMRGQRGNSDAAALCRGDGYKSLTRQDGTPFANTGECIRYAAQNGGVSAIATAVPTASVPPGPIVKTPKSVPIRITPPPIFIPTKVPKSTTSLVLENNSPGECHASAKASGLKTGTAYIIALHITWDDGETEVREAEIPTTHHTVYTKSVGWSNIYGDREINAYLFEVNGEEMVLINEDGPLFLDDECAAPVT